MRINLQVLFLFVRASEVVHMVEMILSIDQIKAGQHLAAVDSARIKIYLETHDDVLSL
jgi:hypothetical protein